MKKDAFTYSFKAGGVERKQVASTIAEALGGQVKYQGPPSFNYEVCGWAIDKVGIVTSPEIQKDSLQTVLEALKTAGVTPEGNGILTLSLEGHTGNTLRNVVNLIWSKHNLIQKALGRQTDIVPGGLVETINQVPIDSSEEFAKVINAAIEAGEIVGESELEFDLVAQTISFGFSNASTNADEVLAFLALCQQISEQAKKQKFTSVKQKAAENDRYSMRCFLLRLGFVGDDYKTERKVLLSKLDGNAAFRTPEALQAANDKRKQSGAIQ